MVKEKKINGNVISRKFSTMLPLDVVNDLTRFARENTLTGLGKFDFGVALRILLNRADHEERIAYLEEMVDRLEMMLSARPQQSDDYQEKQFTFGKTIKEVEQT